MKLRVHNNSIRLRLSQPEVERIAHGQPIVEMLDMGLGQQNNFSYSLVPIEGAVEILADFIQNNLEIVFPKHQAAEWANTERVGVSKQLNNGLTILIEKDFQCLHKRPGEDETQNFPNPLSG